MPIYEYLCETHGRFEVFLSFKDRKEFSLCPQYDNDFMPCENVCPIQVSIPTMKPDKHWAGTITDSGKYVTSEKEYQAENKHLVPATRENQEYIQKKHVQVGLERHERKDQKIERFLANQLAGVDIGDGTAVVKEKNKIEKMRRE